MLMGRKKEHGEKTTQHQYYSLTPSLQRNKTNAFCAVRVVSCVLFVYMLLCAYVYIIPNNGALRFEDWRMGFDSYYFTEFILHQLLGVGVGQLFCYALNFFTLCFYPQQQLHDSYHKIKNSSIFFKNKCLN